MSKKNEKTKKQEPIEKKELDKKQEQSEITKIDKAEKTEESKNKNFPRLWYLSLLGVLILSILCSLLIFKNSNPFSSTFEYNLELSKLYNYPNVKMQLTIPGSWVYQPDLGSFVKLDEDEKVAILVAVPALDMNINNDTFNNWIKTAETEYKVIEVEKDKYLIDNSDTGLITVVAHDRYKLQVLQVDLYGLTETEATNFLKKININ